MEAIAMETEQKLARFGTLSKGAMDNEKCNWESMVQETDMTLYRRPAEVGAASDFDTYQLRVTVEGLSAKEICHYFWDVKCRMDWEVAIDVPPTILATPDEHTVLLHQYFKTIWPAKVRYTTFWSRSLPLSADAAILSKHCVINHSVDYPLENAELRSTSSKSIFALLDVILICETRLKSSNDTASSSRSTTAPVRREDAVTDIAYVCCIDPGGWTPVSLARMAAKKEYPRFIRRLTKYVREKCHNRPIDL
jgi:collagen type IV alpha-3-binding protein